MGCACCDSDLDVATCDWGPLDKIYGLRSRKAFRVCKVCASSIENESLAIGDGETPITWDKQEVG